MVKDYAVETMCLSEALKELLRQKPKFEDGRVLDAYEMKAAHQRVRDTAREIVDKQFQDLETAAAQGKLSTSDLHTVLNKLRKG